ncbi:MAG: hypothetical protein EON54_26575 [Alcaligenaceae bacterium]|nr:MAG: hypothetical protein EON54_26575 [Alcaligenaceae bacterium]
MRECGAGVEPALQLAWVATVHPGYAAAAAAAAAAAERTPNGSFPRSKADLRARHIDSSAQGATAAWIWKRARLRGLRIDSLLVKVLS